MKPILFNTEMVCAILEERKTVTRRNPFQTLPDYDVLKGLYRDSKKRLCAVFQCKKDPTTETAYARYDRGDILWVRETWTPVPDGSYIYKASVECPDAWRGTWRPSIHMPRKAARIFLKVTDVRVERLRDITDQESEKEGILRVREHEYKGQKHTFYAPRAAFHEIWDSTVDPVYLGLYGWDANPWVWVIEFKRISKEEAANEK